VPPADSGFLRYAVAVAPAPVGMTRYEQSQSQSQRQRTGVSVPHVQKREQINVKSGASGVRGSHFSQRTREVGHPRLIRCRRSQNQRQRQRTGVFVAHGRRFAPMTGDAGVSTGVVALPANSRFLHHAVAVAPAPVGMTRLFLSRCVLRVDG
jgi:hypothetical protein